MNLVVPNVAGNSMPAWAWMNGEFVPAASASVSIFDRSFLYGDGLFDGTRCHGGHLFEWPLHLERLRRSAAFLGIRIPFDDATLEAAARELVARESLSDAFVRIQLSRGVGRRGYSPRGAESPLIVLTAHAMPGGGDPDRIVEWRMVTSRLRLPAGDVLGNHKTSSKVAQVLARMEADEAGVEESLLLDTDGHLAEGASSNLFWIVDRELRTPVLGTGALAGVTRQWVLREAPAFGLRPVEVRAGPQALWDSDGVFVTLSSLGVVPVVSLDGRPLRRSEAVLGLHRALDRAMRGVARRA